jgi:hypothetical protein
VFRSKRVLIIIPVLILIPLLTGGILLKLAIRLAHAASSSEYPGKPDCKTKNCPAHSLIPKNNFDAVQEDAAFVDQWICFLQTAPFQNNEHLHSSISANLFPLRC